MKGLIVAAALLLGAPAALAQPVPAGPMAASGTTIEMETLTWGRPLARWSIDSKGVLIFTTPEPDPFKAERLVTRRHDAGAKGYAQIHKLTQRARALASARGGEMPCTRAITDAPYGELRWTGPGGARETLKFYTACEEAAARRILGQLAEAEALAARWRDAGEIIETRKADGK